MRLNAIIATGWNECQLWNERQLKAGYQAVGLLASQIP